MASAHRHTLLRALRPGPDDGRLQYCGLISGLCAQPALDTGESGWSPEIRRAVLHRKENSVLAHSENYAKHAYSNCDSSSRDRFALVLHARISGRRDVWTVGTCILRVVQRRRFFLRDPPIHRIRGLSTSFERSVVRDGVTPQQFFAACVPRTLRTARVMTREPNYSRQMAGGIVLFLLVSLVEGAPGRDHGIPVLIYHEIVTDGRAPGETVIHVDRFREQMKWLHEHAYTTLSLSELEDIVKQRRPIPDKAVVLTFDDGWRS